MEKQKRVAAKVSRQGLGKHSNYAGGRSAGEETRAKTELAPLNADPQGGEDIFNR